MIQKNLKVGKKGTIGEGNQAQISSQMLTKILNLDNSILTKMGNSKKILSISDYQTPLTIFYDEYIDRPKFAEQKERTHLSILFLPN